MTNKTKIMIQPTKYNAPYPQTSVPLITYRVMNRNVLNNGGCVMDGQTVRTEVMRLLIFVQVSLFA